METADTVHILIKQRQYSRPPSAGSTAAATVAVWEANTQTATEYIYLGANDTVRISVGTSVVTVTPHGITLDAGSGTLALNGAHVTVNGGALAVSRPAGAAGPAPTPGRHHSSGH